MSQINLKVSRRIRGVIAYGLSAVLGLVVDFSVVIFVKEVFNAHYLIAVCAGFICGLIVTFWLSNRYAFGQSKISSRHALFVLFGVIGLTGLGILNVLVWLLTDFAHLNYLVSKVLATVVVFAWNYIARQTLYHEDQVAS